MQDVRQLTRAIARGDRDAFAQLYTQKFDFALAVARRASRLDESACLDIVHDAMIRVIRSIRPIDTAAALDAWLARVVTSAAYDHLRAEHRRRRREAAALATKPPDSTAPDHADERLEHLRAELAHLDRHAAELLDLRFRAGMTLEAIGRRLGLTPGAVHGRLGRILAGFRDAHADEPSDDRSRHV